MKILLSKEKITEIQKEYDLLSKSLEAQKVEVAKRGGASASWHETASFTAAQGASEKRLNDLKIILQNIETLPDKINSKTIQIGSYAEIQKKDKVLKYRIVDPIEADPINGKISAKCPLGELLIGKEEGEGLVLLGDQIKILKVE